MDRIALSEPRRSITRIVLSIAADESSSVAKSLFAIMMCAIALVSILKIFSGLSPIWAPWDVFTLLNGAWRIVSGQTPYTEYYNPIGLLAYMPAAVVMRLFGLSASSIVYGNLFFGAILSVWTWRIGASRLSSAMTFLLSMFIFFLAVSARPLGYGITETTYAMIYNRYGYALLSMLVIELFVPLRLIFKTRTFGGGFSAGTLLALLLYCKITYFFAGLAALIVYGVAMRPSRTWTAMLCLGFLFVAIGMFVLFRVNLAAYVQNIDFAARSQSISNRLQQVVRSVKANLLMIAPIYILLVISSVPIFRSRQHITELRGLLKLWAVVIVVTVSGIFLTSSNASERNDVPIFLVCFLVILSFLNRNTETNAENPLSKARLATLSALLILMPISFGHIMFKDIASVIYSAAWNRTELPSLPSGQRFQSETLFDFVIPGNSDWATAYWRAKNVPNRINNGLAMLREHVDANKRIFCLCYTDPFSFALGLPPAPGTPVWWDESFSFSASVYPQQDNLFRHVDLVMIPVFHEYDDGCCKATVTLMQQIYGPYLEKHFIEEDRSEYWILLEKLIAEPIQRN